LMGWWGLPWGIIRSIQAIILNVRSKRTNLSDKPNKYLRGIVMAKIGEVELYKNDKQRLKQVMSSI